MSQRLLLGVACAGLALVARPAAASDPLLAQVEQRARALRAEFEAAAARPLPPKARARLEATRQA